ncbi:hypothetical protein [Mycoplasma seminis]|uniref:DNA (cytosine-5-)-methyltransferase n=1 Tax=Mycoplasma seminis TaxID=512749 RepID=A0ABY9HBT9_9MOLU|nr:hypothetical protein [Mycoplasma seminis]WLP85143.1 hypothetical protein Q8852_02345 [Mycoplasma seminis]
MKKTINLFESFAGIGSQYKALNNIRRERERERERGAFARN